MAVAFVLRYCFKPWKDLSLLEVKNNALRLWFDYAHHSLRTLKILSSLVFAKTFQCRGCETRTRGLTHPMRARYQLRQSPWFICHSHFNIILSSWHAVRENFGVVIAPFIGVRPQRGRTPKNAPKQAFVKFGDLP